MLFLGSQTQPVVTVADGATVTLPCANANRFQVTLGGTGRTVALTGDVDGQRVELTVVQDGTGNRTITAWPSGVAWTGGSAPTLRTAAGAVDVVVLARRSSGDYVGYHSHSGAAAAGGAPAGEATAGVAELATQAETDAGADDARIVTPLKLTNWAGRATTGKVVAQATGLAMP